jgi:alpha,alpha-trehalase
VVKKLKLKLPRDEKIRSAILSTAGVLLPTERSPDEVLGDFFRDAQRQKVYADGKAFVDLVPRMRLIQIRREYDEQKHQPGFDMKQFIDDHFYVIDIDKQIATLVNKGDGSAEEHIRHLWSQLERRNLRSRGTLIGLPYSYVVAGGRFSEQYYWDSYFTMLGLAVDGQWGLVEGMVKNCAYMIRKFGFVPNANRTYYLSRSQPPFFVHMVRLLASHKGRRSTFLEYLPYLLAEYRFWMRGRRKVSDQIDTRAYERVVQMPNGVLLNRYYDDKTTPRPESLREDLETAEEAGLHDSEKLYLDLRAGAESGWDFSSRWFRDAKEITSIHTTDIVPVDLNCLLYQLEMTIAETYQSTYQPLLARKFRRLGERRAATILKYMWNDDEQMFMDYDFRLGTQTSRVTIAGVFPLYAKIATSEQAAAVAGRLERDFLKQGGLVTTLIESGQQWDTPNGWAPLQWVAIQGLRAYGHYRLADTIKHVWIEACQSVYKREGKMVEKYDVINPFQPGGGGEYTLQDGFGWTNGVLTALLSEDKKKA